ncbi:TIGR02679 family protein [Amycolatopsis minnesotensis]|uniref:TIGR02679 family protein n=1 Tax=Amycolatopsis minnesotensis TaxID=337894 RepID=A0ABN2RMR2_9PSEU
MTAVGDDPGWQRILAAARRKIERSGGEVSGTIGLAKPTDEERRVVIGITGHHRPSSVASLRLDLSEVDAALRDAHGRGLLAVLAERDGPVRNRPAEQASEEEAKTLALADLHARCPAHAGSDWFERWWAALSTDGTATRLVRRGDADVLGWAGEVLNRLPAENLPLPVLAEWATGNTKALAGTPLASLVLRALAERDGVPAPVTRASQRERWEAAGVIVDDLASQVLVLNVRTEDDHVVAGWLNDAADFGIPFRLTLHQLATDPVAPSGGAVYVCENPAVLRAAASELARDSATLICTEGQPSAAFHRLLSAYRGQIHWRGDFDWTGLRTTTSAIARYRALPWRMTTVDYETALETGDSEPLKGPPTDSPWDPALASSMLAAGRAIMEERLIPTLLEDLRP